MTRSPTLLAMLLAGTLFAGGCVTAPPPQSVHVLQAQPSVAFRVLGMVSGQGPNIPAAIEHARYQAANMGADAVVVGHQHNVGPNWIVSVKAIKYLAPPPQGPAGHAPGPGVPAQGPVGPPQ